MTVGHLRGPQMSQQKMIHGKRKTSQQIELPQGKSKTLAEKRIRLRQEKINKTPHSLLC